LGAATVLPSFILMLILVKEPKRKEE